MNAQLTKSNSSLTVMENNTPVIMGWTQEQRDLIRSTVAVNATEEQLNLFFQVCSLRGLNPFLKQIYLILRKEKDLKGNDTGKFTATIQTSIDGFRLIAGRTKKHKGTETGIRYDEKGRMYAWAKVFRQGWDVPAFREVSLAEYKGTTTLWNKMPETMLQKCAESAALRMAFPEDLSGLYSDDEMTQADSPIPVDHYLQNVGAVVNTPEQQDTYKEDKKSAGARVKARREALGLSAEDVRLFLEKPSLNPNQLTLQELTEIEERLIDLDTRHALGSLTPEEQRLFTHEDEASFLEAQESPFYGVFASYDGVEMGESEPATEA